MKFTHEVREEVTRGHLVYFSSLWTVIKVIRDFKCMSVTFIMIFLFHCKKSLGMIVKACNLFAY